MKNGIKYVPFVGLFSGEIIGFSTGSHRDALKPFNIQQSLSMKGYPYDNVVAEAMFKIFKKEFVKGQHFTSLEELTRKLHEYAH